LAGVIKDSGASTLRVWDVRNQPLRLDNYRELGTVKGRIFILFSYVFTASNGIIAVVDRGLARWSLDDLEKPPVVLPIEDGVKQVLLTHEYWRGGGSTSGEPSFVYWRNASGKAFLTDLPKNPTDPHVWELTGTPLTFDGKNLVERREHECWLTVFNGKEMSSRKLLGAADPYNETVFSFGKGKYLLIHNLKVIPIFERIARINTYVFSLQDAETDPIILDSREGTGAETLENRSYWATKSSRWLISGSNEGLTVWDLSKPLIAEGAKPLKGIQGAAIGQFFASDRWHIIVGEDRRVHFVDMNSDTVPHATEFFRLEHSDRLTFRTGVSQDRFFIFDFAARTANVWNTSQFENFSSQVVVPRVTND
jgi:hypothetical protein